MLKKGASRLQVYGGRYLNDEEITGMLIATLFAGQHTSSITSAWTGLTMIRDQVIFLAYLTKQCRQVGKIRYNNRHQWQLTEMHKAILLISVVPNSLKEAALNSRQAAEPLWHCCSDPASSLGS